MLSWRELFPLLSLLLINAKLFTPTLGKSPKIKVELLITLKTRPTPDNIDCPSKTSTVSSSKRPWSDGVTTLKLLLDWRVTAFGVNLTDVLYTQDPKLASSELLLIPNVPTLTVSPLLK